MDDLREIKDKNRLEDVIEEFGHQFIRDGNERFWRCLDAPGLVVDVEKQRFVWEEQDLKGDVLTWIIQQNGWEFSRAVKYLKNRALLPEMLRPRLPQLPIPERELEPEKKSIGELPEEAPDKFDPWSIDDRRVREALRLGWDYPGGIEKHLNDCIYQVVGRRFTIPTRFVFLAGVWEDEICTWCSEDFGENWQTSGQVFSAVNVGKNYEMVAEPEISGLYCAKCVERFGRWFKALGLIVEYLAEQERAPA